MKNIFKSILIIALILIAASLMFGNSQNLNISKTRDLSVTELVELINNGEIQKMEIKEDSVVSYDQEDNKIITKINEKESIFEILKYYDIDPVELKSTEVVFKKDVDWMTILWFVLIAAVPIYLLFTMFNIFGKRNKQGPTQMFGFNQSNVRQFMPAKGKMTFKDVAGLKEEKEELMEIVDFLKNPKKFTSLGAKIPKGVLLMGSPGTGKTCLARSVAGESNVPFFHISGSEFVEMFVGVGASRVRSAFAIAKKAAPAILFVDEIDAIGRERGSGIGGGQDEREQTLNQILVEMDGFDNKTNVIVMAATNRPDVLDSALLRPGRFDRRVTLHLPDISEREDILKLHLKNKVVNKDVDTRKIAERTPGFSGADIENLANEAALVAAKNDKKEVEEEDLLKSIEKVILGPERRSHVIKPKEKEITAYHEGGHALVAVNLKHTDPVHKISIISRGHAAGYTIQLPNEDRNFHTRSEILDELAVLMGGYSAEQLIFNEISTGSANDLKVATDKARSFIMKYGMSDLGPISLAEDQSIFLGKSLTSKHDYSEELLAKVDKEMSKLINDAHQKAKDLLTSNKKVLEKIAKALLEKETLEKDEFYALLEEK